MSKKNKPDNRGFVYSTNPDFKFEEELKEADTLPAAQQKLRIRLETKHRAGKVVTLVENFIGTKEDVTALEKKIKNFCGTGGSSKNGEIIVQGDHREKVFQWLIKNGYVHSKKVN